VEEIKIVAVYTVPNASLLLVLSNKAG